MKEVFSNEYLEQKEKIDNWWDEYSYPFETCLTAEGDEVYHSHAFFEFFYIDTGKIQHQVETHQSTLQRGDIFLIPPNIYHGYKRIQGEECTHRDILIGKPLMKELCDSLSPDLFDIINRSPFHHFTLTDAQQQTINSLFRSYLQIKDEPSLENATRAIVKTTISCLLTFLYSQNLTKEEDCSSLLEQLKIKLSLCSYQKIEMQDVPSYFYYTHSYLCRFFKNKTGMSMTDYVNRLKLKRAKTLLRQTNFSVTQIVSTLGFSSESYFFKLFKTEYGITPLQYRKKPPSK